MRCSVYVHHKCSDHRAAEQFFCPDKFSLQSHPLLVLLFVVILIFFFLNEILLIFLFVVLFSSFYFLTSPPSITSFSCSSLRIYSHLLSSSQIPVAPQTVIISLSRFPFHLAGSRLFCCSFYIFPVEGKDFCCHVQLLSNIFALVLLLFI